MKMISKIIITIVCICLLTGAWFIALRSETPVQRQLNLMSQAASLIYDEIYVLAADLLEEAAGYDTAYTFEVQEELKKVYLKLIDTRGFPRKYMNLLSRQMSAADAPEHVFAEAAVYYIETGALQEALDVLKDGIGRTQSSRLINLYESERYAYQLSHKAYDDVTALYNGTLQVMQDGKWGIISTDGTTLLPCTYEKVSTFNLEQAIVEKDSIIFAVNRNNNRVALAPDNVHDFGNFTGSRAALLTSDGWQRATKDFELGQAVFEDLGAYSGGYCAAMFDGLWGVIDTENNWLIPPAYDEIIQDKLGRCYAQDAVFVRSGDEVYMYRGGELTGHIFDDARPFSETGYAAINRGGKWGYVNIDGDIVVNPHFDDALSFGGHLAAVKTDGLWGYISLSGELVIDTVFMQAGSFENGCAPVKTQNGWHLLTLTEYKQQLSLTG